MADWSEVQAVVRKRFQLDLDAAEEFALTLPQSKDREQRVMVRRFQQWGKWLVEIRSAFGELTADRDAESMLRDVLALPIGGIALHGRFLVVVHRELLDDLPLEGLLFLIARVGQLADQLESRAGDDRF